MSPITGWFTLSEDIQCEHCGYAMYRGERAFYDEWNDTVTCSKRCACELDTLHVYPYDGRYQYTPPTEKES